MLDMYYVLDILFAGLDLFTNPFHMLFEHRK